MMLAMRISVAQGRLESPDIKRCRVSKAESGQADGRLASSGNEMDDMCASRIQGLK